MSEITIRDYIGTAKELTAEKVKKLQPGTKVIYHHFDRYGAHTTMEMTVMQSGKKKILVCRDWHGYLYEKPIKKETDRFCYTEALYGEIG